MILLLALLMSAQEADPAEYPQDPDCQEYRDGSTVAMTECLSAQHHAWEQRLNIEYRGALARAEVDVSKLREAQRAWLRYRDANCDAYLTVRGTISKILTGRCLRDMMRDRTLELREMDWLG